VRFHNFDLNLLVALDVLLKERSVTRAAEVLSLSPSAISNSLSRLRAYFDDDLLVQIGRKMELTPRAESLREGVRDLLLRFDSTIAVPPAFAPHDSDRTFRIFASDYTQLVLAPAMMTLAAEQRSTVRFEFAPQVATPHLDLERGEADLLIIPTGFMSPDHPREVLYQDLQGLVQEHRELLSEETVPMREGRLVLMLQAGARGRMPGLVHGRSGTGRSFYFEPLVRLIVHRSRLSTRRTGDLRITVTGCPSI